MAKNKGKRKDKGDGSETVARNRRASHDYYLDETYQAGLVLNGSEIKSVRSHQVNITDGYVQEKAGELWLMNIHITPYKQASRFESLDPMRPRKLLLHKREIAKIISQLRDRGTTMVPTRIYLARGLAKVDVALARGKRQFDKREAIAKRESERQIRRAIKERY